MFEKNLNIGYLLDFYGELLPARKRSVIDMYYNEDFSLSEIAEQISISRQGVRDIIKKTEEDLIFYEEKLGLAKKLQDVSAQAEKLLKIAREQNVSKELEESIIDLGELIKQ